MESDPYSIYPRPAVYELSCDFNLFQELCLLFALISSLCVLSLTQVLSDKVGALRKTHLHIYDLSVLGSKYFRLCY